MDASFQHRKTGGGFTLIELLIVIGIIAILAALVIVAINPNKQLNDASGAAARAHLNSILKGLDQFYLDFERAPEQMLLPAIIDTDREICRDGISDFNCSFNGYALLTELTPDYLATIPVDEENASESPGPFAARGTGYWVRIDEDGRFRVSSPNRGIKLP